MKVFEVVGLVVIKPMEMGYARVMVIGYHYISGRNGCICVCIKET